MKFGKTIGDRIRFYRHRRGWSQTELGNRVGMGQTRLSKIENGVNESYSRELERIAFFLEVPLGAFDTLRQHVEPAATKPVVAPPAKDPAAGEEPGEPGGKDGPEP